MDVGGCSGGERLCCASELFCEGIITFTVLILYKYALHSDPRNAANMFLEIRLAGGTTGN